MNLRGWIYVLKNPSLDGLVKVGFSTKDPALRVKELSSTGVPRVFEIAYEALVERPRDLEQQVHANLKLYHESKEFFRTTPAQAIAAIQTVAKQMALELQLERGNPAYDTQGENSPTIPPVIDTPPPRFLTPSQVRARSQLDLHQTRQARVKKFVVSQPRLLCPHCGSERRPSPSGYCSSCFGLYRGN